MNKNRLKGYLITGVIFGGFIDFFITIIIGVLDKEIYNYIIAGICSLIPVIVFSIFVIIELYKYNRISIKRAVISTIICLILSFLIGMLIEIIIDKLFKVEICKVIRIINTLYQTLIGVVVGTNISQLNYEFMTKK